MLFCAEKLIPEGRQGLRTIRRAFRLPIHAVLKTDLGARRAGRVPRVEWWLLTYHRRRDLGGIYLRSKLQLLARPSPEGKQESASCSTKDPGGPLANLGEASDTWHYASFFQLRRVALSTY